MKSLEDHIEDAAAIVARASERSFSSACERAMTMVESSIEKVLIVHMQAMCQAYRSIFEFHAYGAQPDPLEFRFPGLHCVPQAKIDGYRLDFLFVLVGGDMSVEKITIVECDGHDFHERTKKQASHDKKRDRHFTMKGWTVLRYTGSDIWRAPHEVADEALTCALNIDWDAGE